MLEVKNNQNQSSLAEVIGKAGGSGIYAGSGALAAVALSNPIGAVGGACAAVGSSFLGRVIVRICDKVFNTDKKTERVISKVIEVIVHLAAFFASAAAVMGVSSAVGYSMTFGAACVLSAATGGIAIGIGAGVGLVALAVSNVALCIKKRREEKAQLESTLCQAFVQ